MSRILIDDVKFVVCEVYGVTRTELCGPRQGRRVSFPRQVAMALARRLTKRSTPDIGYYFGGRDHTTVIHATARVQNPPLEFALDLDELERRVRARADCRRSLPATRYEAGELSLLLNAIIFWSATRDWDEWRRWTAEEKRAA